MSRSTRDRMRELVPSLVDELVDSLTDTADDALVQAAMAHLNLVMIHPFRDGNGRLARARRGRRENRKPRPQAARRARTAPTGRSDQGASLRPRVGPCGDPGGAPGGPEADSRPVPVATGSVGAADPDQTDQTTVAAARYRQFRGTPRRTPWRYWPIARRMTSDTLVSSSAAQEEFALELRIAGRLPAYSASVCASTGRLPVRGAVIGQSRQTRTTARSSLWAAATRSMSVRAPWRNPLVTKRSASPRSRSMPTARS